MASGAQDTKQSTPLPPAAAAVVGGGVAAAAATVGSASHPPQSLLSDKAILKHMALGSVVIEPFLADNLSTSRYRFVPCFVPAVMWLAAGSRTLNACNLFGD